ncbi:Formate dehydrogenase subunit alpha [uncultured Desulfobacterium sp.]|uniref:Formate dehydrogenase subunit alpha n=1 Tax=uncultured Desulfobacterium sp. TaxID=201089 RepID=A0A445N2G0_9BACT|nr:Formate dehydrogenase subunit alpha [uncultured Desulfobacterium sp.]
MTNHWIDIKNANVVLIMGSNAAENHPISFKWVLKAKDAGATVIHIDPKFSRTSARSDMHVPIRSGTDIPMLGGMVKFILDKNLYHHDYVVEYTNASFIVGDGYEFKDGLFSGYDPGKKSYDQKKWAFALDENGVPKLDKTLKHPRCVYQLLKKHYERYTLDRVSAVTGVTREDLLKVYETYAATGAPGKAGTVMYALGWTQHTVGVQNIRLSAIVQLLLGNIGVAGGGINALRGEPNVQGSTDHAILWNVLPGYLPMPRADWPTLEDYQKANTPKTQDPKSANWWGNRPKYMVSLLKGWMGDAANNENGFGYSWLPKVDRGVDYASLFLFDRMYQGKVRGGFIFAHNPAQSMPNSNKVRKAMDKLEWLVVGEIHHTETSDFWHRPGVDPKKIKTEVFLLPSCQRGEKDGTISNSGRWHMWHYKGMEPMGESKAMGWMIVEIFNRIRNLYKKEQGAFPEPIMNMDWPETYDPDVLAKKINGWYTRDVTINEKIYKKGEQVASFAFLQDDGSTVSLNWLYCNCYGPTGNLSKRRDRTQTPMQARIGIFPNFSWAWPVNRRIIYNRASVDVKGKPFNPDKAVIAWEDGKWVGDVPDGPWPPMAMPDGKYPFIMQTEGHGQLYGPGRVDGPFPEHYEPAETPIRSHPFSKQLHNPCMKRATSDLDLLADPADPRFPIVLTTYGLTEHWCGGADTRNTPVLLEAEPQLYVEISHELAKEKGIRNGDPVIVESIRGKAEAIAMVTVRMTPFKVQGKTVHLAGMPFCFGWMTPGVGDATNRLMASVADPNVTIPEYKACLVNIYKAGKVTELFV